MPTKLYVVKSSPLHGRGLFARTDIPKGAHIISYDGEFITNEEAEERWPANPDDPFHTFLFGLDMAPYTIDANVGGNAARWINHHCKANCTTREVVLRNGRIDVQVLAKRAIAAGEELTYDYRLYCDYKLTKAEAANYACRCGAKACRGTMLWIEKKHGRRKKRAGR